MNITLINQWRVVNAKGGAEKIFCEMANALAQRGHSVTAICCDKTQGLPGFPLDNRVTFINMGNILEPIQLTRFARNIRSLHFDTIKRQKKRINLAAEVSAYRLHSVLSSVSTDVFVTFQAESTLSIKKYVGDTVPVVTMLHNDPNVFPILRTHKDVMERSVIQVLRPEYGDVIEKIIPSANVVYIPNIVPQFDKTADRSSKTIIHVGRIAKVKRQSMLVSAFASLADRFPEWNLELWGEPDYNPSYTNQVLSLIQKHGIQNRVHLRGTTDDIPAQLADASIFAFPSEYEGFPLALTEALSMGNATIGCKECPGVNTLIRDGHNGILCDSTPESLSVALAKLMSDDQLRTRLGNAAKEDMKSFSPKLVWDQWETLLRSLL